MVRVLLLGLTMSRHWVPWHMGGQNLETASMGHSLYSFAVKEDEKLARAGWVMGIKVFLLTLKEKKI